MIDKENTAGNSTYPKGGFSYSKDTFVVNQTLVSQLELCASKTASSPNPNQYNKTRPRPKIYFRPPMFFSELRQAQPL